MKVLNILVTSVNILLLKQATSENTRNQIAKGKNIRVTSENLLLLHLDTPEKTRNRSMEV